MPAKKAKGLPLLLNCRSDFYYMSDIEKIMISGIKFLAENQQKDGIFLSLTSPASNDFKNANEYASVFPTALILSCLNALGIEGGGLLGDVKKKAVDFLLSQKSENWSFNYWARGSRQAKEMPYPDDMDDTSCSLAALCGYCPELLDGEVLAKVVTVLTELEAGEGGPYRTWLVPENVPGAWRDVDLAVNSNIGYFLSLQDVQLKNIVNMVEDAVDTKKYTSPYYPSVYPIIYFISRFYRGGKKKKIIDELLERRKNDNWGNPLDTALAMSSLVNFGFPIEKLKKSVKYLVGEQKNGGWSTTAFCIDPSIEKEKYYAGTPALTTAFCLEAIYKASRGNPAKKYQAASVVNIDKEEDEIYKEVISRAKKVFSTLGTDLKKQAESCLKETVKTNKDRQIILLPYFFANSLGQKLLLEHKSKVIDLGLANLFGWMAYTVYDDFLDEEGGPKMLSVANVCLREADRIFLGLLQEADFSDFAKSVFGRIDSANAWEVEHCRIKGKTIASALAHPIPDFTEIANLSDRSLGHALGPVGVLCALGYKIDSQKSVDTLEGFRHYIAAKQIHDDMHDWEEDLSRGQINSASATLFSTIDGKSVPEDEKDALQFLQHIFWEEIAVVLCDHAFSHLDQARKFFLFAGTSQDFADKILNSLYTTTEQTLKERGNAKKFIAAYTAGE